MMLRFKTVFIFLCALYSTSLMAVSNNIGWPTKEDVSAISSSWGGGTFTNTCGAWDAVLSNSKKDQPYNICIGESENKCGTAKADCYNETLTDSLYARDYTDEGSVLIAAAVDVDLNCIKICPVQIEAKNKRKSDAWTEYVMLSDQCVFMCRDGFVTPSAEGKCYPEKFTKDSYKDIKRVNSGVTYSTYMPLFGTKKKESDTECGTNTYQRHDVILGVVGWLNSGHGAWVQQLVVRAQRACWKELVSWPVIYPKLNSKPVLVCKYGYKPNNEKNECIPIDETVCGALSLCDGWTAGFDTLKHYVQEKGSCYEYRCKENGYAFASNTDRTCVQCVQNTRYGIDESTGVCIECSLGQKFDKDTDGFCKPTKSLSKTDLKYGPGKTQATVNLEDQCWIKEDVESYKKCVGVE